MEETPQGPQNGAPPPPPPAEQPPQEPAMKGVVSENRNVMIVLAYLWLRLLASGSSESDPDAVESKLRDLAKQMTRAEIAEGERQAQAWRPAGSD